MVTFRYFGNLGLNRWKVLQKLGQEIAKINEQKNENAAILEVYSNTLNQEVIDALTIANGCVYKGWTSGDEYVDLLSKADVAVHVEAFSEEMINRTKWSVSTKISEYVPYGKCIFAVGSSQLSSIKYLENCSEVVHKLDKMKGSIEKLIDSPEHRAELENKAHMLAETNHNLEKNNDKMKEFLEEVGRKPYNDYKEATLKEHQEALYRLLRMFDSICQKHNISYTLFAGTMLGAIRHQGFIPWDDDLDVMMLREDYERFLKLAQTELDSEVYFLQKEFSEHWPLFFSKLRLNNTACLEKYHPKDPCIHQGVYIDIFPCDNASDNSFIRKMQFLASKIVIAKALYKRGYETDSTKEDIYEHVPYSA